MFYRWNVGEDGVLGKKLVETVSYESIYVHTCVFFGTSGESITWECESRRSRRRKKKNRMDVISSRGIGFFETYIYIILFAANSWESQRANGNTLEDTLARSTIINRPFESLSSGKFERMFVNSGISIDDKRLNVVSF